MVALGDGATGVEVGEQVLVYGPWGCGVCWQCSRGWENYCTRAVELGIAPPGLGAPGAMADFMIVDSPRHLVPIGDLDPVAAVPLTDAGLTPYHAIMRSIAKIRPGGWAVVIGAGGLGHMAVQLLKVLTGVRVLAVDLDERKLEHARHRRRRRRGPVRTRTPPPRSARSSGRTARRSSSTSSASSRRWTSPSRSPGSAPT